MSKVYLRPEKIVGQFDDYMLIQNDLYVAYSYLKTIHDMADEQLLANGPVVRALWISSVITYTKCFTSFGPGRSGLDKKNWVDKEFLLAHKKMLDWRNKFIVHREHRVFEDIKVFIELDLSTERKGPVFLKNEFTFLAKPSSTEGQQSLALVENVKGKVKSKIQDLAKKVFDRCLSKPKDLWYQNIGNELSL
jgi:hypothetical protein